MLPAGRLDRQVRAGCDDPETRPEPRRAVVAEQRGPPLALLIRGEEPGAVTAAAFLLARGGIQAHPVSALLTGWREEVPAQARKAMRGTLPVVSMKNVGVKPRVHLRRRYSSMPRSFARLWGRRFRPMPLTLRSKAIFGTAWQAHAFFAAHSLRSWV